MSYQKQTIATRVFDYHHEIVRKAAERSGKSVDAYARDVLVPWAASDLGETPPDMTVYRPDVIAEAARIQGVTAREFKERAAREAAMALVTKTERPPAPKRASGTFQRKTGTGRV